MKKTRNLDIEHKFKSSDDFDNKLVLEGNWWSFSNEAVNSAIPKIQQSNLQFANFLDIIKGRNPKYNKNKQDRKILSNNRFILPGNPIIGNYDGSEQLIITNLEHEKLARLKQSIYSIRPESRLISNSYLSIYQEYFDSIKNIPGATYLIPNKMLKSGRSKRIGSSLENMSERQEFYEALAQGDIQALKEYIYLVNNAIFDVKDDEFPNGIEQILSFTTNSKRFGSIGGLGTAGLRFPNITEVKTRSNFNDTSDCKSYNIPILCKISKYTNTSNMTVLEQDEINFLQGYRQGGKTTKTNTGEIYLFSDEIKIK